MRKADVWDLFGDPSRKKKLSQKRIGDERQKRRNAHESVVVDFFDLPHANADEMPSASTMLPEKSPTHVAVNEIRVSS